MSWLFGRPRDCCVGAVDALSGTVRSALPGQCIHCRYRSMGPTTTTTPVTISIAVWFHVEIDRFKLRAFHSPTMETTRHFTATVYIVNSGAIALHEHKRLGILLPPGGHIDRDELPHEAGLREVREETGLEPTLIDETRAISDPAVTLPRPRHQLLYDVNVYEGSVGHQHIDQIYYATVDSRSIEPTDGEASTDAWGWYTSEDLQKNDIDPDTIQIGLEAIRAANASE